MSSKAACLAEECASEAVFTSIQSGLLGTRRTEPAMAIVCASPSVETQELVKECISMQRPVQEHLVVGLAANGQQRRESDG